MKLNDSSLIIAMALLASVAPVATMAQEPGPESDDSYGSSVMEEIIVTAQKRSESLEDVPIAITVVGQEQLQQQRVYTLADLQRTTPALEMIQAFGGPGGGGQIRGIGTQSFTRSAEGAVGIVVDGVPQGNVQNNSIFDIQQVEVLRGPQGTLFGLTASAGVINMISVAPSPEAFSGYGQLDWSPTSSLGSEFGQTVLRGAVNIPFGENSALRVAINGNELKGVEWNAATGENNELKDKGVRARYLWNASDDVTINLIADYDKRDQNYGDPQFVYVDVDPHNPLAGELAACGIVASYANNARCSELPNYSKIKNYGFSGQLDWAVGNGTLTSITAYRKNEQEPTSVDIMGTPTEFVQIFFSDQVNTGKQFSQEVRFASSTDGALEYVIGAFYSDYKGEGGYEPGGGFFVGTFQLAPIFIPFVQQAVGTETTNKAWALFGQATYHINDRFAVLGGLRYTDQKLTDYTAPNSYDPTSVSTYGETKENNVSWKVGAQYELTTSFNSYATITRGYKGPQVIPAQQGSPTTVIDPEIPTSYEVGVKGSALDGKLGIDANLFYTKVKDYQGQRCRVNGVGVLVCEGESIDSVVSKGFEMSLFGQPTENWYVNGGFIYDNAKFPSGWTGYNPNDLRDPVPGTMIGQTDLGGEQLVGVPKFKFTINTDYSIPIGSVEGFIGADAVYKTETRLAYSGDDRFIYPSHWIVGARLGVRSPDGIWSVELFARNIGNEHEPATLFGGPSFLPPGVVPFIPNGQVNGISGWTTTNSLRQVGLSAIVRW
jgi:iron complex outermembrane recepter protein